MIDAVHTVLYADDPVAARAFFRDVLGLAHVDAHDGWLIFRLPPGELGVHPAASPGAPSGHHELFLMCDDIEQATDELRRHGADITDDIADRGFGLVTSVRIPGGGTLGLYEPKHPTAYDIEGGGGSAGSSSGTASYRLRPMGTVRGGRHAVEDDAWATVTSRVELDPDELDESATTGLDEFSHLDVVYLFDRVDPATVCRGARFPRGREDWGLVGILAQRAKDRPNRVGVSTCELVGVRGLELEVRGLDAVDGTPVLDVKPHMTGFEPRTSVREPSWARELMADYW